MVRLILRKGALNNKVYLEEELLNENTQLLLALLTVSSLTLSY